MPQLDHRESRDAFRYLILFENLFEHAEGPNNYREDHLTPEVFCSSSYTIEDEQNQMRKDSLNDRGSLPDELFPL